MSLKGGRELWEEAIAAHAPLVRLDIQQSYSHPAMLLLTVDPVVHLIDPLPNLGQEGLDAVRDLERGIPRGGRAGAGGG